MYKGYGDDRTEALCEAIEWDFTQLVLHPETIGFKWKFPDMHDPDKNTFFDPFPGKSQCQQAYQIGGTIHLRGDDNWYDQYKPGHVMWAFGKGMGIILKALGVDGPLQDILYALLVALGSSAVIAVIQKPPFSNPSGAVSLGLLGGGVYYVYKILN